MAERSSKSRNQAEVAFRKTQKAAREQDKSAAMQEYEAEGVAIRERSARLKELRLAKEAAEREAEAAAKPATKRKHPAKAPPNSPSGSPGTKKPGDRGAPGRKMSRSRG